MEKEMPVKDFDMEQAIEIAEGVKTVDGEDLITIPLKEYVTLCSDKALLQELEKQGLDKLPMYDQAIMKTFLNASRRY